MIVTADAAHDGKERTRLDEDGKPVTNDCERRGDAEHRKNQHHDGHRDSGNQTGKQSGRESFGLAHRLSILLRLKRNAQERLDNSRARHECSAQRSGNL